MNKKKKYVHYYKHIRDSWCEFLTAKDIYSDTPPISLLYFIKIYCSYIHMSGFQSIVYSFQNFNLLYSSSSNNTKKKIVVCSDGCIFIFYMQNEFIFFKRKTIMRCIYLFIYLLRKMDCNELQKWINFYEDDEK